MDLHNHSTWSDGIHSPKELIDKAILNGVSILGITDHYEYISTQFDSYIIELQELKKVYEGKIKLLIGVEISPYPYPKALQEFTDKNLSNLDFALIEDIENINPNISLNNLEDYLKKIPTTLGLAHTNLFKLADKYQGLTEVLNFLARNNIFWEINTNSAYSVTYDDIIYGSSKEINTLLNTLKETKVHVSIGSDTHDLSDYNLGRLIQANLIGSYINGSKEIDWISR